MVWVALSVLTIVSWWVGHPPAEGDVSPSTPITIGVLAMGLIKAWLIIRQFMELRSAPRWLRYFADIWLVALWGTILAIYLY